MVPIIDWFERRIEKHPALLKVENFKESYEAIKLRLQQLATLDLGITTSFGKVIENIGTGTFGTVYLCENDEGKRSAFKVYHPQDIKIANKMARFRRGYDAMKQLDHPYIVRVYEYSRCPIGFNMDFIDGSNLREFMGSHLESMNRLKILKNIAEILLHAHGKNVIHRDIKPENIIMYYDVNIQEYLPYLLDFDLAWFSTATQLTKDAIGTVFYASPEQLTKPTSGHAHSKTNDIYSFGQVCFFMICERDPVPFGVADNTHALKERLNQWGREKAAQAFLDLYEACTEIEPIRRPQNFLEINEMMSNIIELLKSNDIRDSKHFLEELTFSIVGLDTTRIKNNGIFTSLSGRVLIQISIEKTLEKTLDLKICFSLMERPAFEGTNYNEAYEILSSRIKDALRDLKFIKSITCANKEFNLLGIEINFNGITICNRIITRTIDALERI